MTAKPPDDAPLDRAEAALRRAPGPDGPDDALLARLLDAVRAAEARPGREPRRWRRPMVSLLKLAAAAAVVAAGLLRFAGPPPIGGGAAFAEATRKLRDAQTLTFRWTMELPGKPAVAMRVLVKEPGHLRVEADAPDGPVSIVDQASGKVLTLDPKTKAATLTEPANHSYGFAGGLAGMVAQLRDLAEQEGEPAGKRTVDGVAAEGFRVRREGVSMTVWLDAGSRRLVRVESPFRAGDLEGSNVWGAFRIDPPLDDALFRLEPPAGYASRTIRPPADKAEAALARLLRAYAEHSDGAFPPKLDDWPEYDRKFAGDKFSGPADPKLIGRVQTVVQVQMLLLEAKGKFGYRPVGVKLGDADKLLFWYKPKGADSYRALFGDLHAADIAADRLPGSPND